MPREENRFDHLEEIELEFSSGKRMVRISDISMGGCYVDNVASVRAGEPITFIFNRPGAENIRFAGKVAYTLEGFGFGVQFGDLSDDAQRLLKKIIAEKTGE
ncbi:MAG: PilZ domain-containing protein [Pyrinomonadaceae bacterium]